MNQRCLSLTKSKTSGIDPPPPFETNFLFWESLNFLNAPLFEAGLKIRDSVCRKPNVHSLLISILLIFTSHVSGLGNRIGPVCPCVCQLVSALKGKPFVCRSIMAKGLLGDPLWQKDFGAKELYNTGRGRSVNTQAFSFLIANTRFQYEPCVFEVPSTRFQNKIERSVIKLLFDTLSL